MEIILTLVVAEKPDAAARIANAIDEDSLPLRKKVEGVPVFECHTKSGRVIVVSALGHLYTVASKTVSPLRYYPVWDYHWCPKHVVERASARLARWIRVVSSIATNVDRFVNACDYDIEGSVIGYSMLKYAMKGADKNAQRMKFSTMTERELEDSFKNLAPSLDLGLVEAGLTRHELDWLYGINLSRLLTQSALKQGGGYSTLSSGRVQGPTLRFIVEREEEISSFVPIPFWRILARVDARGVEYEINYEKGRVASLADAQSIVSAISGHVLRVSTIDSWESRELPPYPFDLATLQWEAFRAFHYSPSRTLAIAEKLYLDALVSYPRTSSQKLPADIDYSTILHGISSSDLYRGLVRKLFERGSLVPRQGPKIDPAHPAIYPTGHRAGKQRIGQEMNVYDLIVRRFMATLSEPILKENTRLSLQKDRYRFYLTGSRTIDLGWHEFYQPYATEASREIPELELGDEVPVTKIESVQHFTQPLPRYNPGSLLQKMEQVQIGTKTTRSEIINVLYQRGYVRGDHIHPTRLGLEVTGILRKHCPQIVDPAFTSRLDQDMEDIERKNNSRTNVLCLALDQLRPLMLDLMDSEIRIGEELSEVVLAEKAMSVTFQYPCPDCTGTLRIIRSRSSGKRFVGCSGWSKGCKFSLPLPQYGSLKITDSYCKVCGYQMVEVKMSHRRPSVSCPRCYKHKRESIVHSEEQKIVAV